MSSAAAGERLAWVGPWAGTPVDLAPGTLVVGDLHLDPVEDPRVEAFEAWCGSVDTPGVVVLGDLFEAWFGDKTLRLDGARRVVEALARLTARGRRLDVVPGNRDFLLGRAFERLTGGTVHGRGLRATCDGVPVLVLHGDELCTRDRAYQRMKSVLRSGPVRTLAPRLPGSVLEALARRIRAASVRAVARKPAPEKTMQREAAERAARVAGARLVVVGHAHVYRDEPLAGGDARWIVIDGWGGARDTLRLGPGAEPELLAHGDAPGCPSTSSPGVDASADPGMGPGADRDASA